MGEGENLPGTSLRRLTIDRQKLADCCRRHHIRTLALFGSVLGKDFGPDCDVDVLVEFDPDQVPGFIRLFEIEQELSALFGGRNVDLVTPKFLSPRIRGEILREAETQYAEG